MRKQLFFALAILMTLLTSCATIQEFNEFRKEKAKQNAVENNNQSGVKNDNTSQSIENQNVSNDVIVDDNHDVLDDEFVSEDDFEEINPNDPAAF